MVENRSRLYQLEKTQHLQFQKVSDYINRHAEIRPNDLYLTTYDLDGDLRSITFGEFDVATENLAAWLKSKHGVQSGDTVAYAPSNCIESVVAIFSFIKAGAVILLLSPNDPPLRQAEIIGEVEPANIFHSSRTNSNILNDSIPIADYRVVKSAGYIEEPLGYDRDLFLIGTSGSTATSKIVRQTQFNTLANAIDTINHHNLKPRDRILGCLPINHVNGLHFTLIASLVVGAHAMLLERFDPISYPKILCEFTPRIASVAPSLLDALVVTWRNMRLPASFEYFVSAAAPLSSKTVELVWEKIGARIIQSYGLTETTNFSAAMPIGLNHSEYFNWVLDQEIPSVGIALGNELSILDHEGNTLQHGQVGEVAMRGPNVMAGYFRNRTATDFAFRDDWFHSGDLGYTKIGPNSNPILVLTGRIKNIAKIRGESVSLEEVERTLVSIDGIQDACCIIRPDWLDGEVLEAVIVCSNQISDDRVMAILSKHYQNAALPKKLYREETIPRTKTGKIQRNIVLKNTKLVR